MPISPGLRRSIMLTVDRAAFEALLAFYSIDTDAESLPTGNTIFAFHFALEPLFTQLIDVYELIGELAIDVTAFVALSPADVQTFFDLYALQHRYRDRDRTALLTAADDSARKRPRSKVA